MSGFAGKLIIFSDQKDVGEFYKQNFEKQNLSVTLLDSTPKLKRFSSRNDVQTMLAIIDGFGDREEFEVFKKWLKNFPGTLVVLSARAGKQRIKKILSLPTLDAFYLMGQIRPDQVISAVVRSVKEKIK